MADHRSIAAACLSLERFLKFSFEEEEPVPDRETKAVLVRTEDFDQSNADTPILPPALSIYLYRITYNKTMRAAWSAVGSLNGSSHLPLDLHFLVTAWAENPTHCRDLCTHRRDAWRAQGTCQ